HDASVEEPVEHGGGDHGVVEDLSPGPDAEVGGQRDGPFQVALGHDLEEGGGGLGGEGQVAHLVDDQEAGSGVEAHDVVPASFEGGAVAAGHELGGGGVVGAVAGLDGGPAETDGEHRFPHARRADQQDVGGVFEEPQRAELVDQGAVDARLGVEVVVGEPPGSGEAGEPFQAGQAADLGGGHLDVEESFQEGG